MGGPLIGSLDLDTTSQGAIKTSSNLSSGQKFANALDESVDAVSGIAGGLSGVFPGTGGAVLSAVASGMGGVTSSSPMGSCNSLSGLLGGGMGGGSGLAGVMGGGGALGGGGGISGLGSTGGTAGASGSASSGYQQQLNLLSIQQQMQNQSMTLNLLSAIMNVMHQTAMSIIQNIH